MLTQLLSILNYDESFALFPHNAGFSLPDHQSKFVILAATGKYESFADSHCDPQMSDEINDRLAQAVAARSSLFFPDAYVGYFPTPSGRTGILYLNGDVQNLLEMDRDLIRPVFDQRLYCLQESRPQLRNHRDPEGSHLHPGRGRRDPFERNGQSRQAGGRGLLAPGHESRLR